MTAVDGMDDHIKELVANYIRAKVLLEKWKQDTFPPRTVVCVECPQYKGFGIATMEDGTRPEQLAVRLENGNIWWYPVRDCCIAHRVGDWPLWIKREKKLPCHVREEEKQ